MHTHTTQNTQTRILPEEVNGQCGGSGDRKSESKQERAREGGEEAGTEGRLRVGEAERQEKSQRKRDMERKAENDSERDRRGWGLGGQDKKTDREHASASRER